MSALSTVRQLVLVCIASASLFGQTSSSAAKPTPTEGDYIAHDFRFKSGETLPELRLRYTTFGRSLFAIGSNEEAARLSGINVSRVLILVYTIAGLAAGLACMVSVGRLTAGSPTPDPNLLLTVLAAVLIGGTSFTGGVGGVAGTAIGVVFLGVIQNGLTLSNVSSFWQGIVSGSILIIAVGLGVLRERGWSMRRARGASAAVTEGPVR